jgi:HSP20 family protein
MDEFFEPMNVHNTHSFTPKVDIRESERDLEFLLELAGIRKEDIKIHLEQDMLHITGERKVVDEDKKVNVHRMEQFYGSFSRSIQLPKGLDTDSITANHEDGILRLTIKKHEKAVKKEIQIQ